LVCCLVGLLSCWSFDVLVFCLVGLLSCWSFVLLVYSLVGLLSCWSFVLLVFCLLLSPPPLIQPQKARARSPCLFFLGGGFFFSLVLSCLPSCCLVLSFIVLSFHVLSCWSLPFDKCSFTNSI
jgi:hypothetical protein